MPFFDVMELFEYWTSYPPMHVLMRGYVGYQPPRKDLEQREALSTLRSLSPGRARKLATAPKYIRDVAEQMKKAVNA